MFALLVFPDQGTSDDSSLSDSAVLDEGEKKNATLCKDYSSSVAWVRDEALVCA